MSTIIASGAVIVREEKVLLVKHGDAFWKFCGGKVDDINGESLVNAAKRETNEELNINIEIINLQPFFFYSNKDGVDGPVDIILVHYLAGFSGDLMPGEDITDWSWISFNDLAKEKLAPNIIPALQYFKFIN